MALTPDERKRRKELYLTVLDLVKEFGAWSLNCKELADKWRTPHRTVLNWKVKAEREIGAVDIKSIGKSVKNQMEANLRLAHNAVRRIANRIQNMPKGGVPKNDDIKTFATMLKAYNDTVSKHTDFAERWGYKAVVAQKLEVAGGESEAERLARIVRDLDSQGTGVEDLDEGEPEEIEPEELEEDWIDTPESSNVVRYKYDKTKLVLSVEFKTGKVYDYAGVPSNVFEDMNLAPSKGSYVACNIKDKYKIIE